ncbi:DUF4265 domain-containing protein [Streptomyces sp. NPDC101115]|uniref:DUF4265 domain-containing protein n=1 Tax=Streptomyces sp. NPDC101115 TaxID=3366106 RepID=UPI003826398C
MTADRIKIWFRFVPREGWLPQDTEGLWAVPVGADTARVANVPFLQDGVAEGDVVRYTTDAEGMHWATGRAEASGNVTIRVLPERFGPLGADARAVHERFARFGLGGESFSAALPLVALTVPADAPMAEIKALLVRGTEDGWWHWETGCTTDTWNAA